MWLLYASEAAAEAAQAAIWDAIKPPFETRAGLPLAERVTQRWAEPRECAEGWAIPMPAVTVEGAGGALMAEVTFPPDEVI